MHVKFQDHRFSGSVEEVFKGNNHIWPWRPSWSCDLNHLYNFGSLFPRRFHIKFSFDWPSGFREEDFLKMVDGRRRRTDAGLMGKL